MVLSNGSHPTYCLDTADQGCPQDVKSQDRDETEMVNLQDRDETFQRNVSRPPRDRDVQDRDYIPARFRPHFEIFDLSKNEGSSGRNV